MMVYVCTSNLINAQSKRPLSTEHTKQLQTSIQLTKVSTSRVLFHKVSLMKAVINLKITYNASSTAYKKA